MIFKGAASQQPCRYLYSGRLHNYLLRPRSELITSLWCTERRRPKYHIKKKKMALPTPTFVNFSALPPELRNQIWADALPRKDGRAIYPYRRWCWHPRPLSKSDTRYTENDDNLRLVFQFDLLYLPVTLPLAAVNREARSIALDWARRHGVKRRFYEELNSYMFVRHFIPNYDTLFIPGGSKTIEFCHEPWDRLPGGESAWYELQLRQLAVPEASLADGSALAIFDLFFCPLVLFVVIDAPSQLEWDGKESRYHRWELERRTRDAKGFVWHLDKAEFLWYDRTRLDEKKDVYSRLKQNLGDLATWLSENVVTKFEVRPVTVIKV